MLEFRISTHLRFGAGESEKLAEKISEFGYSKVAVIVDQRVIEQKQVKKILMTIQQGPAVFDILKNESVEPTYDYLEEFKAKILTKGYDCLVGIGGGSTIDLAKGLAVLMTNEGSALSFRGFPKLKNRPLAVVAIPTTAGSGSEATYNAVFTDSKEKRKLGINSIMNFPVCAIVDPLLTVDCPPLVTASSGADALVHALESFIHLKHTYLSRMYSREAFGLLFNNLFKILGNPSDIEVRGNVALGAYLAGVGLVNSGSGFAGAFSYPLGVFYKVPHGFAGAVFLAQITRFNVEKGYLDYAQLFDLIDGADKHLSVVEKNILFAQKIQELMDKLGIPKNLNHFKLGSKDVSLLVEQYDSLKGGISQNPIEVTKVDASKIINRLYERS